MISFLIFFTQDILIPSSPPPVNYWGKFRTQTNFLKQSTYADFFAISKKEPRVFIVFVFKFV